MRQGKAFVLDILEMLHPLNVRERAMFGAYGVYCDEKFVMIIGDDQVFIKRSDADPAILEGTELAPPYESATDWHLVPEDLLREPEWLREAVRATADALPAPKPKRARGRHAPDRE
jgi:TfoX/Sxy family transcriptional regulator of competence genes